jgi:RES domain-containing protein
MPSDLVQVEIDVPDELRIEGIEANALPRDWQAYPSPSDLQRRGDAWLSARSTAILRVPSAVIPEESNFLLNPQHVDARKLTLVSTRAFTYDSRLTS